MTSPADSGKIRIYDQPQPEQPGQEEPDQRQEPGQEEPDQRPEPGQEEPERQGLQVDPEAPDFWLADAVNLLEGALGQGRYVLYYINNTIYRLC